MQEKENVNIRIYVYNMYKAGIMGNEIVIKSRKSFKDYIPSWLKNIHSMFYYYLFLLFLGVLFFCTSLFINYFTTPFTGDYTAQQFAFYTNGYDDWWHFFTTGEFVLYDQNTFLGADNIGSNSFYYLFDPFFLPILLVPRQLVPQGMAILTIFKMSAAGMVFFVYMRYLGASRKASKITGIAYAFSGWVTWYLWFNHFTEISIAFPLILLGIERVLRTKKPWLLAGAVCLMGFVNFFFCLSLVICAFLYAMFRYFQRLKLNNWKDNLFILLMGFLGFAVGLMLPFMVVFPAAMHALTAPRANNNGYLAQLKESLKLHNIKMIFKLLTDWKSVELRTYYNAPKTVRGYFPFVEFIFPVTSCRGTPLTVWRNESYDNVAGSFYCFLPMTMLLVPAFKDSFKNKHFSVIAPLAFFIFALFTPICYFAFHGFTEAYSRWTIFVVTSILAYTGLYLDKLDSKPFTELILGWGSLIVFIVAAGLAADKIVANEEFSERVPIWLAVTIEIVYVSVMLLTFVLIKKLKKVQFYNVFTGFIVLEIAAMGAFVIQGHGVENYYYTNKGVVLNDELHALVEKTKKQDKSYYRNYSSLASGSANNDGMRNGYNGTSFFHSVYNYNTADFCNWSSITGDTAPYSWSGVYPQKRHNVDALLGVKYYYIEDDYFQYQQRRAASSEDFRYNVPFNYADITDQYNAKGFRVYKNVDYIDFALTYDKVFVTEGGPSIDPETDNYLESYTGLFEQKYSKNTLALEELYNKGAIINKSRNPGLIEELEESHPDITVEKPNPKHGYRILSIDRYQKSKTSYTRPYLTFYNIPSVTDASGKARNSLQLTAQEYLDLNIYDSPYTKTGSAYVSEYAYRMYVGVIQSPVDELPNYDSDGNVFFITLPFYDHYDVDVYLVDDNNKIITYDNHNDGFYHAGREGKQYRAFYTSPKYEVNENGELVKVKDAPKVAKIIFASRSKYLYNAISVYVEKATDYQTNYDRLKEYVVTDVKSSANKYTFKSNFDKERVVVTRLAYEDGFTLKMKDASGKKTNVKVFNGQGGFVSFISGTGECSYELTYYTPNLKLSSYVSAAGVTIFIGSMMGYLYVDTLRRRKERFFLLQRENKNSYLL